jgi:hypothetical protein
LGRQAGWLEGRRGIVDSEHVFGIEQMVESLQCKTHLG